MKYIINTDKLPSATELLNLFSQTTWANKRSIEGIEALLAKTDVCITIWNKDQLIGFGRAITDGTYRALIDDVIIDEKYRGEGLGGMIIKNLKEQLKEVEEIFLNTDEHLEEFYKKYGFEKVKCLTMVNHLKYELKKK